MVVEELRIAIDLKLASLVGTDVTEPVKRQHRTWIKMRSLVQALAMSRPAATSSSTKILPQFWSNPEELPDTDSCVIHKAPASWLGHCCAEGCGIWLLRPELKIPVAPSAMASSWSASSEGCVDIHGGTGFGYPAAERAGAHGLLGSSDFRALQRTCTLAWDHLDRPPDRQGYCTRPGCRRAPRVRLVGSGAGAGGGPWYCSLPCAGGAVSHPPTARHPRACFLCGDGLSEWDGVQCMSCVIGSGLDYVDAETRSHPLTFRTAMRRATARLAAGEKPL